MPRETTDRPDAAADDDSVDDPAARADTDADTDDEATDAPEAGGPASFPDIAGLRYEQAREELVGIVATLEAGQAPLEDSMRLWRRGEALAAHCAQWLDGAQAEIEQATGRAR